MEVYENAMTKPFRCHGLLKNSIKFNSVKDVNRWDDHNRSVPYTAWREAIQKSDQAIHIISRAYYDITVSSSVKHNGSISIHCRKLGRIKKKKPIVGHLIV